MIRKRQSWTGPGSKISPREPDKGKGIEVYIESVITVKGHEIQVLNTEQTENTVSLRAAET